MVKIIVDSTSDIPQEEAARLGVTVVPLTVRFDEEEYRDGVDLLPAEFFARLAVCRELPTTSQVSSGVFMDVFREALADKDDEIVGYEFINLGKMMEFIKKGDEAGAALEKAKGHYGQFDNAAKYIDPRQD